jgi:hypothetical protein
MQAPTAATNAHPLQLPDTPLCLCHTRSTPDLRHKLLPPDCNGFWLDSYSVNPQLLIRVNEKVDAEIRHRDTGPM